MAFSTLDDRGVPNIPRHMLQNSFFDGSAWDEFVPIRSSTASLTALDGPTLANTASISLPVMDRTCITLW
jgi:hypothetical protein